MNDDYDLINLLALSILDHLGNQAPTEKQINSMESLLMNAAINGKEIHQYKDIK